MQQLLVLLVEYKINRFAAWLNPLTTGETDYEFVLPPTVNDKSIKWSYMVKVAWRINPLIAVHLRSRFPNSADIIEAELAELAKFSEIKTIDCSAAANIFLRNSWKAKMDVRQRVKET